MERERDVNENFYNENYIKQIARVIYLLRFSLHISNNHIRATVKLFPRNDDMKHENIFIEFMEIMIAEMFFTFCILNDEYLDPRSRNFPV